MKGGKVVGKCRNWGNYVFFFILFCTNAKKVVSLRAICSVAKK